VPERVHIPGSTQNIATSRDGKTIVGTCTDNNGTLTYPLTASNSQVTTPKTLQFFPIRPQEVYSRVSKETIRCSSPMESLQTDFEPNVRDTIGMVYFRNDDFARVINYLSPNLADSKNHLYAYALSVITMCNAKLDRRATAEQQMKEFENWQPPAGMKLNHLLFIQQLTAEAQMTSK